MIHTEAVGLFKTFQLVHVHADSISCPMQSCFFSSCSSKFFSFVMMFHTILHIHGLCSSLARHLLTSPQQIFTFWSSSCSVISLQWIPQSKNTGSHSQPASGVFQSFRYSGQHRQKTEYLVSFSSLLPWPESSAQILKVSSVPFLIHEVWDHFVALSRVYLLCAEGSAGGLCSWSCVEMFWGWCSCSLCSSLRWWTG